VAAEPNDAVEALESVIEKLQKELRAGSQAVAASQDEVYHHI